MRTRFRFVFTVGSLLALAACSGGSSTDQGAGDGEIPGRGAGAGTDGADSAGPSGSAGTGGPSEGGDLGGASPPASGGVGTGGGGVGTGGGGGAGGAGGAGGGASVEPGTLTAGVWDDNRNFDFFLSYRSTLYSQQLPGLLPLTEADHRAAHSLFAAPPGKRETLDVSLIIDTTGSMGDEITYLQTEFIALSDSIFARYPNAEQRWSLVLYRDTEDTYVVRWFDFRTDPDEFQEKLAEQAADGGGDFPEAPDMALSKAADLSWRTGGDTARLAFWVADAPHHDSNAGAMAEGIRALKDSGVAVYPVASSGVDELTEFTMRSAAQLTGGRYLFLTNDSGVGGDHKEPTLPCYYVTKLDRAILRMVDVALSGVYREPEPSEILRTGGDPLDGACELSSGAEVLAY
ncbi:vWA domain-containing protein [Sorangium sp. So ce260]|uniref:vWA domain-containing protein n=1 Tax=Sorangium sp. So ce260 TaxID=3133291 RepID=UPI003F6422D5